MPSPYSQPCEQRALEAGFRETSPCPQPRRPFVLAAAILGSAMVFIDGSALTVALPALRDDLSAGPEALNWIVNSYVLMLAAFTLIGGAAADRFGRRTIFIAGAAGFAIASILCGFTRSPETLMAARILQGLFGAMLAPASLALIAAAYPREERAKAIGAWAGASALTTAGGPVIGGFLVDTLHWSAIFFMNAPMAAAAIFLAARFSPETTEKRDPRPFDIPGAILCALALALMAYGLVGLGEGSARLIASLSALAGGAVVFAVFCWREMTAKEPMAPPSLFAIPALAGANAFTLFAYAGLGGALFALPLILADERGWSAAMIGAAFLPFTLAVGILSRPLGGLAARYGVRLPLAAGAALAAVGFTGLSFAAAEMPSVLTVFAPMAALGLGFALLIPPLTDAAVSSAPDAMEGLASG